MSGVLGAAKDAGGHFAQLFHHQVAAGVGHGAQVHYQRIELALAQGLQLQVLQGPRDADLHAAGVVAGVAHERQGQQGGRGGPQADAHMPGVATHMVLHHLVQLVGLRHHLARMFEPRSGQWA